MAANSFVRIDCPLCPLSTMYIYRVATMTSLELFQQDVFIERDIPYIPNGDERQKLDVYAPPNAAGLPVAVWFYGGGWRSGDKRLFEHLGRAFSVRGIVTVAVNYRLSPAVSHPAHAQDCAAAVGWTYRNIARFGGDPQRIFLTGHSAGSHLASLLALDRRFLEAENVPAEVIRGVVAISGASDLVEHVDSSILTSRQFVEEAFGSTPEELRGASPLTYVHAGAPPFLLIAAENDPEGLQNQVKRLADALREAGGTVRFITVKGRDHFSIVRRFGPGDDTTAQAAAEFIRVAGQTQTAETAAE